MRRPGRVRPAVGFWLVAGAFVATMIGTTLPTPLYVIYQARWHFSAGIVTLVFATYAGGVLFALLAFGRVSDQAGRLPVLFAALASSALSTVVFVFADATAWLFVGRFLSGVSAGLVTGTATATLSELAGPAGLRRAAIVATAAATGGLGLGPLIAGAFAEYAPHPTVLVFVVYLGVLLLAGAALSAVPETVPERQRPELRFVGLRIPEQGRATFIAASVAGFASFALMGLFTALAPSLLGGVLHVRNHALGGFLVFVLFAASTATQIGAGGRPPRATLRFGQVLLLGGLACMVAALRWSSMPLFVACAVVGGTAAGAVFLGSLATANALAPPEVRGQVVSTYFTFAYVGLTIPVVGVGFSAEHVGYLSAVSVCAAALAALSIGTLMRAGSPAGVATGSRR